MVMDEPVPQGSGARVAAEWSWWRVLPAVRSSLSLSKILIGTVGLLLVRGGLGVLSTAASWPGGAGVELGDLEGLVDRGPLPIPWEAAPLGELSARLGEPMLLIPRLLRFVFESRPGTWQTLAGLVALLWVLLVWGLAGGAIARITLVASAGKGTLGLIGAIRFAVPRLGTLVAAPLEVLLLVALALGGCAGYGLVCWLPFGIGELLGSLFLFLPLLLGLLILLLLAFLAAGWPLLHASIAAETADALDALSRAFGYIRYRLPKFVGMVAIVWAMGVPTLMVVEAVPAAWLRITSWGLALTAPASAGTAPGSLGGAAEPGFHLAAALRAFWLSAPEQLVQGWIYSYTWTSFAIIYLVLRSDVDGTPWSELSGPARSPADRSPPQPPPPPQPEPAPVEPSID
jgi:hypothetical protein